MSLCLFVPRFTVQLHQQGAQLVRCGSVVALIAQHLAVQRLCLGQLAGFVEFRGLKYIDRT